MKLYRTVEDLDVEAARLRALAHQAETDGDTHKAASYHGRADKFERRAATARRNQKESTTTCDTPLN